MPLGDYSGGGGKNLGEMGAPHFARFYPKGMG